MGEVKECGNIGEQVKERNIKTVNSYNIFTLVCQNLVTLTGKKNNFGQINNIVKVDTKLTVLASLS